MLLECSSGGGGIIIVVAAGAGHGCVGTRWVVRVRFLGVMVWWGQEKRG